ncbi:peptide/nickel transport system ATP-binding protein [Actinocorallia herbida]|uniref:Peptide/nickel transport system ATP-binding protein n=1 Tax=Actinocorallia herbida TaxID=58109 RepID=A0A3N1CV64_9ACTN|nr:ABC transporter ATP-binding protein [Actinocorallia herbida]ROO85125.1 peptide/nickel transport system ATP-binding protein [Actinocorallia herbida]
MSPLLEVRGLRVAFPGPDGPVTAVAGVGLTVGRGEVVGVVGESGSGKSVTARSIMGLLRPPGRIEEGTIILDGTDLRTLPAKAMRAVRGRRAAMVFQDPQSTLNPVRTVGDQVAEALTVHGAAKVRARERAVELLELVGIPDARRRAAAYPHEFSGGMRQRVVIAIALANDPDLLIADEPTTALDVTVQAQILRLLTRLRDDLGIAVLMITHDMGVVAEICDRVAVMYAGRVVETGPVTDVFAAPRHPYTAALLRAMPGGPGRLAAIPGSPPDPAALPAGCAFHPRCPSAATRCAEARPALPDGPHEAACWFPLPAAARRAEAVTTPRPDAGPGRAETPGPVPPVLEVRELRVDVGRRGGLLRRPAPVFAVDGVSLHVAAGETLGLVGESGCGKSTFSRAVVGLGPEPSGEILLDGHEIRPGGAELRRAVQYVFQDPYGSLNPRRTIRQTLLEAIEAGGGDPHDEEKAAEMLETVGLGRRHLDLRPHAFSGGQRQRVGIARALAASPRVLLCDEPVSALDVSIQAQIINLLADLRDGLGLGYLFIAHDLGVVRHLSDRVAVMYLGRIVETGPAERVYTAPLHPYTAALLSSSPEPSPGARRERIVLGGDPPSAGAPPSGCRFRTRCPIGPLHRSDRSICAETAPPRPGPDGAACHFPGELKVAP